MMVVQPCLVAVPLTSAALSPAGEAKTPARAYKKHKMTSADAILPILQTLKDNVNYPVAATQSLPEHVVLCTVHEIIIYCTYTKDYAL